MKIVRCFLITLLVFSYCFGFAQDSSTSSSASGTQNEALSPEDLKHKEFQDFIDAKAIENANLARAKLNSISRAVRKISPTSADFLESEFLSVKVIQYIASIFILLLTFFVTKYLLNLAFKWLLKIFSFQGKGGFLRDFIRQFRRPVSTVSWGIGIYISLVFLIQDSMSVAILSRVSGVVLFVGVFWALIIVSDALFFSATKKLRSHSASTANLLSFLRRVLKFFIILISILFVLTNCGVNVNTIVASLGIGGMALAFASQDTIANFFGSVSIILDRPFIVGERIKANSGEGTVEAIGFRSTKIRTYAKSIISVPNSILAKESIENFSQMSVRRVSQTLGLTYSTTAQQMKKVIQDLREIIEKNEGVSVESGVIVEFLDFAASSLDISVIYYTKATDYATYTQVRRDINLAIMGVVEKNGLSFAFPSTSLYIEADATKAK